LEELTDDEYKSFMNKVIYYMTDLHSSQKSKGVKYRDLVRTYQVTFCMHPVFPDWPDFVNRASMCRPTRPPHSPVVASQQVARGNGG
jgi:hypothetical protein